VLSNTFPGSRRPIAEAYSLFPEILQTFPYKCKFSKDKLECSFPPKETPLIDMTHHHHTPPFLFKRQMKKTAKKETLTRKTKNKRQRRKRRKKSRCQNEV
jgi:hypothetical protein